LEQLAHLRNAIVSALAFVEFEERLARVALVQLEPAPSTKTTQKPAGQQKKKWGPSAALREFGTTQKPADQQKKWGPSAALREFGLAAP
jgi:hypothetical protein